MLTGDLDDAGQELDAQDGTHSTCGDGFDDRAIGIGMVSVRDYGDGVIMLHGLLQSFYRR
jgi:hypothetical protein